MASRPVRVFISYSHDSKPHVDRVLLLADRLRSDGVEAEIDQYEPSPVRGWPRWMEDRLAWADVVLIVVTETYARRFGGNEAKGRGLGVNWEGAIIAQELYEAGGDNRTFIPVVLADADKSYIPLVLRRWSYYDLSEDEGYESLYRRLTGQPAIQRPTLGRELSLPERVRQSDFRLPRQAQEPLSASTDGRIAISGSVTSSTVIVGSGNQVLVRRPEPAASRAQRRDD